MIASDILTPMGSTTASISKGPISLSAKRPRLSVRKEKKIGVKIDEKLLRIRSILTHGILCGSQVYPIEKSDFVHFPHKYWLVRRQSWNFLMIQNIIRF